MLFDVNCFILLISILFDLSCILTIFNLRKNPPRYTLKVFNSLIALLLFSIPFAFVPHHGTSKIFGGNPLLLGLPLLWLVLLAYAYRLLNWIAIKKVFYPAQPPAVPETSSN